MSLVPVDVMDPVFLEGERSIRLHGHPRKSNFIHYLPPVSVIYRYLRACALPLVPPSPRGGGSAMDVRTAKSERGREGGAVMVIELFSIRFTAKWDVFHGWLYMNLGIVYSYGYNTHKYENLLAYFSINEFQTPWRKS